MDWRDIAQRALRAAVDVRQQLKIERSKPLCVLDAAADLGLRVQILELGNFEGLYGKDSATMVLNAARPSGRRNFTCAHELGHWHFKHGNHIDGLDFDRADSDKPEERLVNQFASFLLMPRRAVDGAFMARRLEIASSGPVEMYSVANQLGVGYETLIKHLCWGLEIISSSRVEELISSPPKQIRAQVLGYPFSGHLILAHQAWAHVPIDLEVDDMVVLPAGTVIDGQNIESAGQCPLGELVRACSAGLGRVITTTGAGAIFIRVSRRGFTGWAKYRHFPDPDTQ